MAGADRVMSPYVMGGKRMATSVLRPNVLDFLELAMHTDDLRMMIEELNIGPNSKMIEASVAGSNLRKLTGVTIIAIKKTSGKMIANPSADEILHDGDVLIVLGTPEQLENAEKIANPSVAV
jgi:voltage-gated potassium channel